MNEQRNLNTPYEPLHSEPDGSVGGLLRQLTREVPSLFTKELALAKAELNESLRATKAGAASVATGGAVLLAGFIILLMAAVYFLGTLMETWLAALIVGGVVMVIGLIMVAAGKKKFEASSFKPERTLHSLNKDKEVVRGHA
ncbi:phage holin family protein [Stutzerimonas stutzeri]|uniref:Phage holin family protein n=1 Tax=Stutzerimonas stutzeri TaxID=316 RepID=A0A2N8T6Q7_STUST|nr:phage holin family protein [Stutzerimonas stutzeri]MCQ4323385.1 phage holin family protein [Stutzerimonas stutzeri]PNG10372.1 phage holin family protein [Stutzerimonas stutzeri]